MKLLVLSDVDVHSTYLLSEKFVPLEPTFDGILCCGPFGCSVEEVRSASTEMENLGISNMSSALAALENIVCRVIYLPSEDDPPKVLLEQLHLTPNSVSIYSRRLALTENLFVTGYTEVSQRLDSDESSSAPGPLEEDSGDWEELGSQLKVGQSWASPAELDIDDILEIGIQKSKEALELIHNSIGESIDPVSLELAEKNRRGLFVLNYVYAHTLNQFLFQKSELLQRAGINICIVNNTLRDDAAWTDRDSIRMRMPAKLGDISIIIPYSLRRDNKYLEVDLELKAGVWHLTSVQVGQM